MILREAFDYEFSRLDPTGAHIDPPSVAVYETLMVKGPDWGPHAGIAESWQVSDDGLEWRVRLRPGLRFHSGAACNAKTVRAALEHLRFGAFPGEQLWYWDPVDTVRAEGRDVLVFRLHHPYARLPSLLWGTHTAVYNEPLRARENESFGYALADGTGPFRLMEWSPERIVAERSPLYPGALASFFENDGPPRLQRIEWVSLPDEGERLAALERGEVDCVHGPPLDAVDGLREDPRFTVIEFSQASNVYLALDWRRSELGFDEGRVRRAFSLGLDRMLLIEDALAGHGTATYGPVPPGDEFYDPEVGRGRGHDPAQAAVLLDQAGWRLGPDGVRAQHGRRLAFECVGQDDTVLRRVAVGVRDQLARLGVRLELRFAKPFADFYDACAAGPASFVSKWLWQDPLDAIIGFTATRGQPFPNYQRSSIPELDEAFRAWLRAETRAELRAAAGRVQRLAADELPYIPLLTPNDVWAHGAKVHGWRPFPANLYPFYQDVWIEED